MEDKPIDLQFDRERPLEAWVDEVIKPILSAIGYISSYLEDLYQEIS